eukprot:Pgem_evm1s5502
MTSTRDDSNTSVVSFGSGTKEKDTSNFSSNSGSNSGNSNRKTLKRRSMMYFRGLDDLDVHSLSDSESQSHKEKEKEKEAEIRNSLLQSAREQKRKDNQLLQTFWKSACSNQNNETFTFVKIAETIFQFLFYLCPECKLFMDSVKIQASILSNVKTWSKVSHRNSLIEFQTAIEDNSNNNNDNDGDSDQTTIDNNNKNTTNNNDKDNNSNENNNKGSHSDVELSNKNEITAGSSSEHNNNSENEQKNSIMKRQSSHSILSNSVYRQEPTSSINSLKNSSAPMTSTRDDSNTSVVSFGSGTKEKDTSNF